MSFDLTRARTFLQSGDLPKLFVEGLGWEPCKQKVSLRVGTQDFTLAAIAGKRGFVAWLCESKDHSLPDHATRLKLDRALAQTSFEHLIVFASHDRAEQSWMWVRRETGRPLRPRIHDYQRSQPGDSLLQKLHHLYVSIEEEEAGNLSTVAMSGRARSAFDVERVTKRFYDRFKEEHSAFLTFIKGIPVKEHAEWYASVMLNRTMFVYFIQKQGFLDGDRDYLRNRLARCKQEHGKDKFYSFYRYFLLRLFHEGFGKRRKERSADLEKLLGNIPFLNGGMFDVHELEKPENYGNDIQIKDDAFERIFDYFDHYEWVLDPQRTVRNPGDREEINPDVLGYIFEKYINQKQMGAYYTKEDITEYIGKNTIIPFILDTVAKDCKVAFENPDGPTVWDLLCENPDRYIYAAVRHGTQLDLPPDIAAGIEGSVGVPPASSQGSVGVPPAASQGSVGVPPAASQGSVGVPPASSQGSVGVPPASSHTCGQDARAPFVVSFFDPFAETAVSTHKLPHWNQADCFCFITWRLDDAMPQEKLDEWQRERDVWLKHHPEPWDETNAQEYHRIFSNRLDEWLDAGHGSCLLKQPAIREIVAEALTRFDTERYTIVAYVIMPNHVHVLLQLKPQHSLAKIVHSWKSFAAKAINKALNRTGTVWQAEYWDRLIRNERHLAACMDYIRDNPTKAHIEADVFTRSVGVPPASFASSHTCGQDAHAPLSLHERRKNWNKPAPPEYALPTEIWREVVARRQRYAEIKSRIEHSASFACRISAALQPASSIQDQAAHLNVNDLISLNLDIRQFAQDVIATCEGPHLLAAFWKCIAGQTGGRSHQQPHRGITVLDPTCGSGAFLFAALNILEPLYEACLDRMEQLVADAHTTKQTIHPDSHLAKFDKLLKDLNKHLPAQPTDDQRQQHRKYFIYKSIILNNLFGVDIMDEAIEICKLRLFLKLVAQVEPDPTKDNLGIEPLPDIDFNIKAGNRLVGYATYEEVKKAVSSELDFDDSMGKIEEKAREVERLFALFRQMQTDYGMDAKAFTDAKQSLKEKLKALDEELNRRLAGEYGVEGSAGVPPASSQGSVGVSSASSASLHTCGQDAHAPGKKKCGRDAHAPLTRYTQWLASHKPFHWFVEFYGIITSGGFDVIIGNPPYADIPKDLERFLLCRTFKTALEQWSRDEDLYTLVVERSLTLLKLDLGKYGMILPLSVAFSTKKPFVVLRNVLASKNGWWFWSHFDRIPSALFGNDVRTRCSIVLFTRTQNVQKFEAATTAMLRWNAEYRDSLFKTLHYARLDLDISAGIPKVGSQIQADVLKRLQQAKSPLAIDLVRSVPFNELSNVAPHFPQPCVYVGGTAYNWFPAWRDIPATTNIDGEASLPARTACFCFPSEEQANIVFALLCSSMGYWWWAVASDAFNLKKWLMERFPVSVSMIPTEARKPLAKLGANLRRELKQNYVFKDNKGRIGNYVLPACNAEIVAIDTFLGTSVPMLSVEFFQNIREFNACVSGSNIEEHAEEEDDQ